MSDFDWAADGIERAEVCGGILLETYRRPGFTGGIAVRRPDGDGGGCGIPLASDPWWDYEAETDRPDIFRNRPQRPAKVPTSFS